MTSGEYQGGFPITSCVSRDPGWNSMTSGKYQGGDPTTSCVSQDPGWNSMTSGKYQSGSQSLPVSHGIRGGIP